MATKNHAKQVRGSKAPESHAQESWLRRFLADHPEEVRVGAVAFLLAFFFTHGLPLASDDFRAGGIGEWLVKSILPMTSAPGAWGYGDYPLQTLIMKILGVVFGAWGLAFYFLKCAVFGALCGTLHGWLRGEHGVSRTHAWLSVGLFAASAATLSAVMRHAEFAVHGQLVACLLFAAFFRWLPSNPARDVYAKGLGGIPRQFLNRMLVLIACAYFGSRLGAGPALVPWVLLCWMMVFRKELLPVYWPPLTIAGLATLPWSTALFKHLPPFIPGAAGYEGVTYSALSFARILHVLLGDATQLARPAASVAGAFGILALAGAVLFWLYRSSQESSGGRRQQETWGFAILWFVWAFLAAAARPGADPVFEITYAFLPLVPATLLFALTLTAAARAFPRAAWFAPVAIALVTLQGAAHLVHTWQFRYAFGHNRVAAYKAFEAMEKKHPDAQMVTSGAFNGMAFRDSSASAIKNRKAMGNSNEIKQYPVGSTYLVSWSSTLDPSYSMDTAVTGCATSLFDLIAGCDTSDAAYLLRFVGEPPEVARYYMFDGYNNHVGAREAIDVAYARDPANHGVAFLAGFVASKQGDYTRMEEIYDAMGPYFLNHTAVVYNWGLAKQAKQKFAEASKLFQRAYAMVPKDFSIGFNLADSYFRQGKKSRALAMLNELMVAHPNNPTIRTTYEAWQKQ